MEIVLKKLLLIPLTAALLSACTNGGPNSGTTASLADDKELILGTWAMMPLRNGIANVVEFGANGKSRLHPFNCAEPGEREVEESDYRISEDGKTIHISSPHQEFDLQVLVFQRDVMRLAMSLEDMELRFSYLKINKVAPLCALYEKSLADDARKTPYHESDFIPNPAIPAHAGLDRYVGKWANDEGVIQVEVLKDISGNARLSLASSENWHHLYNDVSWVGDELHYQSFAYSEKASLFKHPYHKSIHRTILTPMADAEKIRHSFFIGTKRFDYVLTRMQ